MPRVSTFRQPSNLSLDLLKYLGYALNCKASGATKKAPASLSGHYESGELSALVQEFIEAFVLCSVCGLPELVFQVRKKQMRAQCRGCGSRQTVSAGEKFDKFAVTHPPDPLPKQSFGAPSDPVADTESVIAQHSDIAEESSNVEWFSDTSDEAVRKRLEENVPQIFRT